MPKLSGNPNGQASAAAASAPPQSAKIEVPECIPCTQRLSEKYKASVRAASPTTQLTHMQRAALLPDQPMLPFTELPPYQVRRRSYVGRISAGTVRYGVPAAVKFPDIEAQMDAAIQIPRQLVERFPGAVADTGIIRFFRRSNQSIMDIRWTKPFGNSIPLEIDGNPLVFIGSAALAQDNWITLMIFEPPKKKIPELVDALNSRFFPHEILDCWSTSLETTTQIGNETRICNFFTGKVFLLVQLDMEAANANGFTEVNEVVATFPEYVPLKGERYQLSYLGRLNHCRFCKSTSFYEFHTYKDCEDRLCARCRDPGHRIGSCPVDKQEGVDAKKEAVSSQAREAFEQGFGQLINKAARRKKRTAADMDDLTAMFDRTLGDRH